MTASRLYTFPGRTLDSNVWTIDTVINSLNIPNQHQNVCYPPHAIVQNGYLRLMLSQAYGQVGTNPKGIISQAIMLHTIEQLGFGSYEFCGRQACNNFDPTKPGQVISGSLTGFFIYVNNSQTEIDQEAYGGDPGETTIAIYKGLKNKTISYYLNPLQGQAFQNFRFDWSSTRVDFYLDGVLKQSMTLNVPQVSANLYVCLFGSDDPNNRANVGKAQYAHLKWIRYTAPGETPIPTPA